MLFDVYIITLYCCNYSHDEHVTNKITNESPNIGKSPRLSFFRATVESVLLCGADTWPLIKQLETKLDGNYTTTLRKYPLEQYAKKQRTAWGHIQEK